MEFKKISKTLKFIKENIKIRSIVILIILLSFNSFAWFIYSTKVSGGLSARVSSWNIEFKNGEDQSETNMNFDVDRIYPGMETYVKELKIKNTGEITAKIIYNIKKIEILGQVYEVNETTTSEDLLNKLQIEFPFKLKFVVLNGVDLEENSSTSLTISLEWPFESGNDELDTLWGEKAFEYYSVHPKNKSVHIEMNIEAVQSI